MVGATPRPIAEELAGERYLRCGLVILRIISRSALATTHTYAAPEAQVFLYYRASAGRISTSTRPEIGAFGARLHFVQITIPRICSSEIRGLPLSGCLEVLTQWNGTSVELQLTEVGVMRERSTRLKQVRLMQLRR